MAQFKDTKRPKLSARGLRFGVVVARFNYEVTNRLLTGAKTALRHLGAKDVEVAWVPGAFEIPLALKRLARRRRYDALLALGSVIRGETPHFDYVSGGVTRGVMEVMLDQEIPIAFGILTTNNQKEVMARAGGNRGNKGKEAALVAIEMALLMGQMGDVGTDLACTRPERKVKHGK